MKRESEDTTARNSPKETRQSEQQSFYLIVVNSDGFVHNWWVIKFLGISRNRSCVLDLRWLLEIELAEHWRPKTRIKLGNW